VIRFLIGCPSAVYKYEWQNQPEVAGVYTDSDWAGCVKTRRSTSGGTVVYGKHLLQHWSRTQVNVALSSGEAELNACLKAGCEALGLRTLMGEIGVTIGLHIFADSSAAAGTLNREGAGKVKHLEVKQLWMQQKIKEKDLEIFKIPRAKNSADAFTHAWTASEEKHFSRLQVEPARPLFALLRGGAKVHNLSPHTCTYNAVFSHSTDLNILCPRLRGSSGCGFVRSSHKSSFA
jgi:hypothetical protein